MKITNTQNGPRGVNAMSGSVLIEPGQTVDVELSSAEHKVSKATGWFSFDGKDSSQSDEYQGRSPAEGAEMKATHRGGGSYSIMQGDTEVAEKLSKDEAEKFNAMSPAEKEAFVKKA